MSRVILNTRALAHNANLDVGEGDEKHTGKSEISQLRKREIKNSQF